MASYPASIVNFGAALVDYVDVIRASHVNNLQSEVVAIETTVGTTPTVATSPSSSGTWSPGTSFATVSARLANIEQGIVGDSHTQYVKLSGSTITGNLTFSGGAKITGLPTPSASSDAATKSYVDSAISTTNDAGYASLFLLIGA